MLEKIQEMLADALNIPVSKVTPDAKIVDDLGADSIAILQLLMTIEEDYGIVIPDEKLATFDTVGDVVAYLDSKK